jgi:hypothetical protein
MLTLETVTSGPPPVPDPARELEPWRDADGAVCARVFRADASYLIQWGDASLFSFHPGQPTVRVWPTSMAASDAVTDHFSRRIQPLLLQANGYLVLHASAASAGRTVIAFAGRSGTGKSTLGTFLRGHRCVQWADDAVVLDAAAGRADVLALPFSGTAEGRLHRARPGERAPLGAIVVMTRQAGAPAAGRIEPVEDASALTSVLAHAHVFEPARSVQLVDEYASLLSTVPVFRVCFDHATGGADALAGSMASWMRARDQEWTP